MTQTLVDFVNFVKSTAVNNSANMSHCSTSLGMHSQQRDTDDLFAKALNSHFVDSFSADACYSMDRMDQTFSMLEPQRQTSTDEL